MMSAYVSSVKLGKEKKNYTTVIEMTAGTYEEEGETVLQKKVPVRVEVYESDVSIFLTVVVDFDSYQKSYLLCINLLFFLQRYMYNFVSIKKTSVAFTNFLSKVCSFCLLCLSVKSKPEPKEMKNNFRNTTTVTSESDTTFSAS